MNAAIARISSSERYGVLLLTTSSIELRTLEIGAAFVVERFFLKCPTARRVAGAAMAQPLDQIGSAIPSGVAVRSGHIGAGACKNRVPDRQRPARSAVPWNLVRLVRLFDRWHVLHEKSVERLDVLVGDLR